MTSPREAFEAFRKNTRGDMTGPELAAFADLGRAVRASDIPQRLYDSEINFSISCFWDGGFGVKLGDEMNGFDAATQVQTFQEALCWLDQEARRRYPDSLYVTGRYPEGWRQDGEVSARN